MLTAADLLVLLAALPAETPVLVGWDQSDSLTEPDSISLVRSFPCPRQEGDSGTAAIALLFGKQASNTEWLHTDALWCEGVTARDGTSPVSC